MPEELMPHVDSRPTRRKQYDFSDVTTSSIGRRWAEIDEHVLYIENPHPRLVLDPNRPPPYDLEADLRKSFRRLRIAGSARSADLVGIDAVRPVTFAFEPVLPEPRSTTEWRELVRVLQTCAANGPNIYVKTTRPPAPNLIIRSPRRLKPASYAGQFVTG
jgi:hypothetical protein